MTLKQKQRLELKIKKIRAILAAERQKFGGYDDSRGLRYLPPELYLKLEDYKGGLVYTRWFSKNFPTDVGFPEFLFEWTVILFMNGKMKDAERKAMETFFRNVYVFDKFFGRPIQPIDKLENWAVEKLFYLEYFTYTSNQSELSAFSNWLTEFENSEKFKSMSNRFIDAQIKLKTEHDPEKRHFLYQIEKQFMNEI
jgi:hypothetical protein